MIFAEGLVLTIFLLLLGGGTMYLIGHLIHKHEEKREAFLQVKKVLAENSTRAIENVLILYGNVLDKKTKQALLARKDDLTLGM